MRYKEGEFYIKTNRKVSFSANLIIDNFLKSDNFTHNDQILLSREELSDLIKRVIIEVKEVLKNENLSE